MLDRSCILWPYKRVELLTEHWIIKLLAVKKEGERYFYYYSKLSNLILLFSLGSAAQYFLSRTCGELSGEPMLNSPPGDTLYLLHTPQANHAGLLIWITFCLLSSVQIRPISSNKWVGLNFLNMYLFCPHFFSFGLRCQSLPNTLPRWWIYWGLGKLELNMCIFSKLRHGIKRNSKSSVNSYQPTSVCVSVQLSTCAIPHVLKQYLSWGDARLHLKIPYQHVPH